jgi:hypothetical protein
MGAVYGDVHEVEQDWRIHGFWLLAYSTLRSELWLSDFNVIAKYTGILYL